MQAELTQVVNCKASIYALDDQIWIDRGHGGQFMLYYYSTKPDDMLVRWWRQEKSLAYQLQAGKLKSKGERSWALRALNMDKSPPVEEIIAIRFATDEAAQSFQAHYERVSDQVFHDGRSHRRRTVSRKHQPSSSLMDRKEMLRQHERQFQRQDAGPQPKQVHSQSVWAAPPQMAQGGGAYHHAQGHSHGYPSGAPGSHFAHSHGVINLAQGGRPGFVPADSGSRRYPKVTQPLPGSPNARGVPPPPSAVPGPPAGPPPGAYGQPRNARSPPPPAPPRQHHPQQHGVPNRQQSQFQQQEWQGSQRMPSQQRMPSHQRMPSQPRQGSHRRQESVGPRVAMPGPRPQPTNPEEQWSCSFCTFLNKGASLQCDMCRTPKPRQSMIKKPWTCGRCTVANEACNDTCYMCQSPRSQGRDSQHATALKNAQEILRKEREQLAKERERLEREKQAWQEQQQEVLSRKSNGSRISHLSEDRRSKWQCPICTLDNSAHNTRCDACGTPNRIKSMMEHAENMSSVCGDLSYQTVLDDEQGKRTRGTYTSNATRHTRNGSLTSSIFEGDTKDQTGDVVQGVPSKSINQYQMIQAIGGSSLRNVPYANDRRKFDKVVGDIVTYNNHPRKVLGTLKSVAKKLLNDDPKYRTLDTSNPRVEERLIGFEGVLDFLYLLGFEADPNGMRLVCKRPPSDELVTNAIGALDASEDPMSRIRKTTETMTGGQVPPELETADGDQKEDNDTMTMHQIVLWSTHEQMRDHDSMETLIMCHKEFADSMQLFQELKNRYFVNPPAEVEEDTPEMEEFIKQTMKPVQLIVVKTIRSWMKNYWTEDWEGNEPLLEELDGWVRKMQANAKKYKFSGVLAHTLRTEVKRYKRTGGPRAHGPDKDYTLVRIPRNFSMGRLSANELADQITLMDFRIFREIRPRECLGQAWKKSDNRNKSPNILRMIDQFNNLTRFVQIQILNEKSLRDRRKSIRHFIKMADRFRDKRNYNSLCAIFSALNSAPIHRLKLAWEKLPPKHQETLAQCKTIFARDFNHRNLRQLFRNAPAPSIPHIGIFLSDLVFIDDAHENQKDITGLGRNMFNFSKSVRCADRIKQIQMYQLHPYTHIEEDERVQKILVEEFAKLKDISEDRIWDLSTQVKKHDARNQSNWI